MKTIEIDDEVFSYLQKKALPFIDTPNSTLRRLFGMPPSETASHGDALLDLDQLLAESLSLRTKAPRANLQSLARTGVLSDGQTLYLIDYQGNRVNKMSAEISGADLLYNGRRYSMSKLAQELLGTIGFKSTAIRGPAHWVTSAGRSVQDLWQEHLNGNPKN